MKILSVTREDGRVVELTREEFKELATLASALEGKTENETHWSFQMRHDMSAIEFEADFTGVFGAIKAFYENKFRVNELRQLANRLQGFLDNG